MKVIIITGSVGSGKSTLAKKIDTKLGFKHINVNKLIKSKKLFESYDKKRNCVIVDVKKLNKFLLRLIKSSKENLIIDSHLSHYLPKKYVDLCIVTKCSLKILEKRLKKRRYSKDKVKENLECEIFDICLNEAKENKHKILVVDTTKSLNLGKIRKLL